MLRDSPVLLSRVPSLFPCYCAGWSGSTTRHITCSAGRRWWCPASSHPTLSSLGRMQSEEKVERLFYFAKRFPRFCLGKRFWSLFLLTDCRPFFFVDSFSIFVRSLSDFSPSLENPAEKFRVIFRRTVSDCPKFCCRSPGFLCFQKTLCCSCRGVFITFSGS